MREAKNKENMTDMAMKSIKLNPINLFASGRGISGVGLGG